MEDVVHRCHCRNPKSVDSEADGVVFKVCAKRLGGCGHEINPPSTLVFNGDQYVQPTGPCQYANCGKHGVRFRQNTSYIDEEQNWFTACEEHQKVIDEYWDDMWQSYYSGVL